MSTGAQPITEDPELLAESEVEGKAPRLGILVSIAEAYTQCSKALIRSDLWDPENHIDREGASKQRRDPPLAH